MCGCQNYGPFLGALNIRCRRDPKKDHNFDNHPNNSQNRVSSRTPVDKSTCSRTDHLESILSNSPTSCRKVFLGGTSRNAGGGIVWPQKSRNPRWILKILHDPKYLIHWELWYYGILRTCTIFRINSSTPTLRTAG